MRALIPEPQPVPRVLHRVHQRDLELQGIDGEGVVDGVAAAASHGAKVGAHSGVLIAIVFEIRLCVCKVVDGGTPAQHKEVTETTTTWNSMVF